MKRWRIFIFWSFPNIEFQQKVEHHVFKPMKRDCDMVHHGSSQINKPEWTDPFDRDSENGALKFGGSFYDGSGVKL